MLLVMKEVPELLQDLKETRQNAKIIYCVRRRGKQIKNLGFSRSYLVTSSKYDLTDEERSRLFKIYEYTRTSSRHNGEDLTECKAILKELLTENDFKNQLYCSENKYTVDALEMVNNLSLLALDLVINVPLYLSVFAYHAIKSRFF